MFVSIGKLSKKSVPEGIMHLDILPKEMVAPDFPPLYTIMFTL